MLERADGWMLESDGNWYSRPNRIPAYFDSPKDIKLMDRTSYTKGHDNFLSYEFREIDYRGPDGRNCMVLIQRKIYNYRYTNYPNWADNYTKSIKYFVFARSEFDRLSSGIANNTLNILEAELLYIGRIEGVASDYGYIDMVEKDLYNAARYGLRISSVYPKELLFMIYHETASGTVRFNIVEASYDVVRSYDTKYGGGVSVKRIRDFTPALWVRGRVVDPVALFDNCHYAAGFNEFSRFIRLPVPVQHHSSPSGNFSPLGW